MIAAMSLVLALAPSLHAPPRLACGIARRALLPRMEDAVEEKVVAEKPEVEPKPAPGGMRSPSIRSELKEQITKDQGTLTLIPWREEMQERFEAADDGDGFINSSELGSLMTACGESLSADEVSALFKEADTNGDGKINFPEWNKVMIDSATRMVRGEKKTGGGGRKLPFIN